MDLPGGAAASSHNSESFDFRVVRIQSRTLNFDYFWSDIEIQSRSL